MSGQGTGYAAKGASLTIGKATNEAIPISNCDSMLTLVPPDAFVNDVFMTNKDNAAARKNGEQISKAMNILSLEINCQKSAVIVSGGSSAKVKSTREDLVNNPVLLQSKPVPVREQETYLGFVIHEKGFRASVQATIDARVKRAWMKAVNIKTLINHPLVKTFGWLHASCVLMQSTLPSVLPLSCGLEYQRKP